MFVVNHTIVDWGPHGMWLSNCSEEITSTVCDYVMQVTWKVTDTMMEKYHDKGLLGWFDGGLVPPCPRILLDKQSGPKQWDIWKPAARPENLELGPDISQGPVVVIVTISFTIIIIFYTGLCPTSFCYSHRQSITHNFGSGTIILVIVLVIIFVVYHCLSIRLVNTKQTQLVRTFFTNIIKGGIVRKNLTGGFLCAVLDLSSILCPL